MHENRDKFSLFGSLLSVRFLLTAFILVLAAIGLQPGMRALSQRYTKKAIAIRRPLKEFEISSLPTFRNDWDVTREKSSVAELEALRTDEYIIMKLKRRNREGALAKLFITYYNNPNDKVPHTPEMCNTQAGEVIRETSIITIETPELGPENPRIQGRLLIFDIPKSSLDRVVLYCFYVEGKFRLSRNRVRLVVGMPGNQYTYFSKIEIISFYPNGGDPTEAIKICKTLFREVLSALLKEYLPGKDQLKGR